ncbi:MAG TPA: class I SAM-dependent methyltransferase [Candidatus Dormibacteraeota bacterium]|nr:class I SAM-dependent methyltransferase [Candidatus Dormibacteraeota bacterium]
MSAHDVFNRATSYEPYVGRWSRLLGPVFLQWLAVAPGGRWLDVGCGTGALTEAILAGGQPVAVAGIDPSGEFIRHATAAISDARASFSVGSATSLDFSEGGFDAVASALVLNFVPEPLRAVAEMRRVVRPGGIVGAYVWDYSDGMRMMRVFWDAALELDPTAAALDEGSRFTICSPHGLRDCFESSGLEAVEVRALDCQMTFVDFDDYWNPFLGGQGSAPAYAMSLDEARRAHLRELIRSRLPGESGGEIHMVSRAWAIKGRRAHSGGASSFRSDSPNHAATSDGAGAA